MAVADVAVKVARRLNGEGFSLDVRLCEAAGLLHDMARTEPDHQAVAAAWLRERGHCREAEIIGVHMHYPQFHDVMETDETDLVCLGDRVCIEDEYVGPEKRFDYIFNKHKGDPPGSMIFLEEKKQQLLKYVADLEKLMGMSLDELMTGDQKDESRDDR